MPPLLYHSMFPRSQGIAASSSSSTMPAPTSSTSEPESVTITLNSARRPQDITRHIVLRLGEPVPIGRSSRSEVKNLSSSTDNALFDCPVISRKHAEFELKLSKFDVNGKHQIYITDTRSMHGTSVNSQKLQPSKPFHLRVGDVIRLGDSVNHGQNSYDGVMVTLDNISVAGQQDPTQVKSRQSGISPSDYESDIEEDGDEDGDDDDEEEVKFLGSAHTTPGQPADKGLSNLDGEGEVEFLGSAHTWAAARQSAGKPVASNTPLSKPGSSMSHGIILDDENGPRPIAAAPAVTSRSIVVPDTYDEDSYDRPSNAPNIERTLQFDEEVADCSRTAAEPGVHEEEDAYSDIHISDDAQSQDSNYDSTSDAASSRHSFGSEAGSMADFQDNEEDGWAEQDEISSGHDEDQDEDEEEGPEIMSSKRTQSVEIGTLGDAPAPTWAPSAWQPAAPTRSHYDPVRGLFSAAPLTDNIRPARSYDSFPPPSHWGVYADVWNSSKWDVGPTDLTAHDVATQDMYNYQNPIGGHVAPYTHDTHDAFRDAPHPFWAHPNHPHSMYADKDVDNISSYKTAMCPIHDGSKKRKASEISTSFEPMATAPEFQSSDAEDPHVQKSEEQQRDDSVIPAATDESTDELRLDSILKDRPLADEPLTDEPQPKKLKTVHAHTKKSMLRTAAIEATKYTAGAIIGGIGLVTILASPIGEALASC